MQIQIQMQYGLYTNKDEIQVNIKIEMGIRMTIQQ